MLNKKFTQFTQFALFTRFANPANLENQVNCVNSGNQVNKVNFLLFVFYSLLFALSICIPSLLEAKVTGVCSNCHTMHNSQNGSAVVTAGPQSFLLSRAGCTGCHSSTSANTWKDSINNAPIVFNTVEATFNTPKGLAGGNFYYVSGLVDNTGHNVFSTNVDGTLGNTPPGGAALTDQLRCSGRWGCHGHNGRQSEDTAVDDETNAIKGAHHGDDTPPLAGSLTDVAKNYRFLLGIKGKEDTDWEQDYVNTNHNEYKGASAPPSFTDNATISFLCGECHGNYHSAAGVGTATPWLRHPTDSVLKSTGEYASYTTYSMVAPVARPYPDSVASTSTVYPGTDIVMCLSCHRAHASAYFKLMRWDYKSSTLATALSGCNVCHTSKN